jgi:phosphatidylglycerophosphate synthase
VALKYLLPFFLVKEFWQLFAMIGNLRKGKALDGALMSGKVSTTVLFSTLVLMVLWPTMSEKVATILTTICFIFLLIAFVDYIRAYLGDNKKIHDVEA